MRRLALSLAMALAPAGCGSRPEPVAVAPAAAESDPWWATPRITPAPPGAGPGFVSAVPADVLFATDRAELGASAEPVVAHLAELARASTAPVVIEGCTDDSGPDAYNLDLGARRAKAVAARLVALGVDPARIRTHSWGEARPLVPNDTPSHRAQNRRVDVRVGE